MEVVVVKEGDALFDIASALRINGNVMYSFRTCEVCLLSFPSNKFVTFEECGHGFCRTCVRTSFRSHVVDGKVDLTCLQCSKQASPRQVKKNLPAELYNRYLDFSLRQYLALQPHVRQCIAPDCPFAYIIDKPSNCEDNHFVCQREGCNTEYCAKCRKNWHEGMSCKKAKKRGNNGQRVEDVLGKEVLKDINIKMCPRCGTAVEKIDDGGCNHVVCNICKLEFCWLCLRPGTELHYLSPTGCPMYGRQRWVWWKTWGLRLCLWTGAPLLVLLIVLCVFFLALFLAPILITYMIYSALVEKVSSSRGIVTICVIATILGYILSPIISVLLALIVLPLALLYFYCFIPIHLIVTHVRNTPQRTTNHEIV